ncbi:hypothetical protein RJ640_021371 [Escallonia rubra]|uniref:Xylanase inhibitor N-terminal domain-containing protein n=1 Tax=Escallonia rubra TaxID=112253 RepID=A0AA88RP10_9ASTE|nr:hypothetical protein RJ640_021371 [Escallonia rubra]
MGMDGEKQNRGEGVKLARGWFVGGLTLGVYTWGSSDFRPGGGSLPTTKKALTLDDLLLLSGLGLEEWLNLSGVGLPRLELDRKAAKRINCLLTTLPPAYRKPMSHPLYPLFFFFLLLISPSFSAFLAPVRQDQKTRLYTLSVYLKTPLQPTNLFLDLGASFSWVDCTQNYTSTTYHSIPCNSSLCNSLDKLACSNCFDSPGLGCSNDSCALFPENSAIRKVLLAQALVDTLALPLSDGRNPGRLGLVHEFVLSCSKTPLLKGFPKGTTSLGRSNFSLPAQVSSIYSIPSMFALCLSGSPSASGVAFFAV